MSRRSRAIRFPIVKRREPIRDRSQLTENLIGVALARRGKVINKPGGLTVKSGRVSSCFRLSTSVSASDNSSAQPKFESGSLFIPKLIRRR